MSISRLSITGVVHDYVPTCVLVEIADAHGISYGNQDNQHPNFSRNLIKSITETSPPHIDIANNTDDWQLIARFVNKASKWPQGKLIQAYNFLISFIGRGDPLDLIPDDFTFGLQTPTCPTNINACMLYKTCVYHKLSTTPLTTINQMAYAVKMLREGIGSIQRRALSFVQSDARKIDLINILMMSNHEILDPNPDNNDIQVNYNEYPKGDVSHEMLLLIHQSLNSIPQLQHRIDPTTHSGAIALASVLYSIDLSKAVDPAREYKLLKITGRNSYCPGDKWMNYWYQRNSDMFDLSISFNPIFPECYYIPDLLREITKLEGYTDDEIASNSAYELMQMAYVTETFYMGEYPNLSTRTTIINLDDIEDINYGELFCYGALDDNMKLISVEEMTLMFNTNRNFTNPFTTDSVFSNIAINKLKRLLLLPTGPVCNKELSSETITARKNLLEIITSIEFISKSMDEPTRSLISTYNNASPDTKSVMLKALIQLLHIGMYMRGWCGTTHDYPVVRAPVPVERECEVYLNITNSIADYETTCRSLGKIGRQINNLPLVRYTDGQYQVSNNSENGLTIGDRIGIIKDGENTSNIASCVRLSSNWICATSHKYLVSIGQPVPFDIFHLRQIS